MGFSEEPQRRVNREQKSRIVELTADAWKDPDQRKAECVAIRACEAYAEKGVPVGANGVIPVRLDHVRNRHLCLVRANSFLIRIMIKDGRVVTIKSLRIANLA